MPHQPLQLPHAHTLVQARSTLAALADGAATIEASSGYERVLIDLDRLHADQAPALDTSGLTGDPEVLYAVATSAIEELPDHGVDPLQVELLLAMLDDAYTTDRTPERDVDRTADGAANRATDRTAQHPRELGGL